MKWWTEILFLALFSAPAVIFFAAVILEMCGIRL